MKAIIELPDDVLTKFVQYTNDVCDDDIKPPIDAATKIAAMREWFYNDGFDARDDVHIELIADTSCPYGKCTMQCVHPENALKVCTNPQTQICGLCTGRSS